MTQLKFQIALIGQHKRLLFYAMNLASDSANSQDLLQKTYLKALTFSDKFTDNSNIRAWVFTIMKNTLINNYRQNKNTKNTFGNTNEFHLNSIPGNQYQSPESICNSKEIIKCINALEDEYKIPFNMFLEGFKYKEIAEELSLPLGTIKSRIFCTREKLEKSLKKSFTK